MRLASDASAALGGGNSSPAGNASASLPAPSSAGAGSGQAAPQPQVSGGAMHYTGEPISVNLKNVDLLDFFRLIHEISGLNVVVDPKREGNLHNRSGQCAVGSGHSTSRCRKTTISIKSWMETSCGDHDQSNRKKGSRG